MPDSLRGAGPHRYVDTELPTAGSYRYWIEVIAGDGTSVWMAPLTAELPSRGAELLALGPNPTTGPLRIVYSQAASGSIRLSLHDVAGRLCARIEGPRRDAGLWEWEAPDLRDAAQRPLSPGVYFLNLEVGTVTMSSRVILVRGK